MPSPVLTPGLFRSFLANGQPNASGRVSFFAAGTATPLATYPTAVDAAAGTNANANPVILNSSGEAQIWVNALSYKIVTADAASVTLETIDNYSPGVSSPTSAGTALSEWVGIVNGTTGLPPTLGFVSATSFTVNAGSDLSTTLHVGRRVRTTNTAGTVYSTITVISYSAPNNTVTVINDGSGVIDSGLSAVAYGVLSYVNDSYLDPRTQFCVQKNGNQTGFNVATKIATWTVQTDPLSEWDNGNNRWVPKYIGKYLITATLQLSDTVASQVMAPAIFATGAQLFAQLDETSATAARATTKVIQRVVNITTAGAAGQYIEVFLVGTTNTTVAGTNSSLSIARIP